MSFDNAKENLRELTKELNMENVQFDESHTCILGIDDYSFHLTYEKVTEKLYVYCPIGNELPTDKEVQRNLYEALLIGSMLGGHMAGGGVGISLDDGGLILMHLTLDMRHAPPTDLRSHTPIFIEAVEKWRKAVQDIMEGRTPDLDIFLSESQGDKKMKESPPSDKLSGGGFIRG